MVFSLRRGPLGGLSLVKEEEHDPPFFPSGSPRKVRIRRGDNTIELANGYSLIVGKS